MPGVPSSRGCDECRRQKKKCDQGKPTCSRCLRLDRRCVGSGQRRYIWTVPHGPSAGSNVASHAASAKYRMLHVHAAPYSTPTSHSTRLAGELVAHLSVTDDVRYSLAWAYGVFLLHVPARIGINPALDAGVAALLSAHHHFRVYGGTHVAFKALTRYSQALRALRNCLDDVATAGQPETLGAIMVLLICQGFLGYRSGCFMFGDAEGAAQVLRLRGRREPKDDFERDVLLALRGPVVMGSIHNPRSAIEPEDFLELTPTDQLLISLDQRVMRVATHLPSIMGRSYVLYAANSSARNPVHSGTLITTSLAVDCNAHYITMQQALDHMHKRLLTVDRTKRSPETALLLAIYHRTYAMSLGLALLFNVLLQALGPRRGSCLEAEALQYAKTLLSLDPIMDRLRPLGSVGFPFALATAWAALGSEQSHLRPELELLHSKYTKELYAMLPGASPREDLQILEKRLRLEGS